LIDHNNMYDDNILIDDGDKPGTLVSFKNMTGSPNISHMNLDDYHEDANEFHERGNLPYDGQEVHRYHPAN